MVTVLKIKATFSFNLLFLCVKGGLMTFPMHPRPLRLPVAARANLNMQVFLFFHAMYASADVKQERCAGFTLKPCVFGVRGWPGDEGKIKYKKQQQQQLLF